MTANHTSPNKDLQDKPPETREDRLRRFLTSVILAGVIFNIISWGGAAGFLALKQSGASVDWGGAGRLPSIQLDGPGIRQTDPSDATLPPTPIEITSVGRPTDLPLLPTITATKPAERTPTEESNPPPATSTP